MSVALLLSILMAIYWLVWASDFYISSAHLQVSRTDTQMQGTDFASLISGNGGGSRTDQLTLRDHLLSIQMLDKLDEQLHLREHYSDNQQDVISRMWDQNVPIEWFHRYFQKHVSVELDEFSGLLIISAEAYKPVVAQAIVQLMVKEGELFMNATAHQLAQTQVDFLQQQLTLMAERSLQARQALLQYQNKKNLASPQATAESIQGIVSKLDAQMSELNVQRSALLAYLVPSHPSVTLLEQQIAATRSQLAEQKSRMASSNSSSLNLAVEEYQRLQAQAVFAEDIYKAALVTLEKGKLEALRTIKKLSLVREANLPEYPLQPKRIYNTVLSVVLLWMLVGVFHLIRAIIKDHQE